VEPPAGEEALELIAGDGPLGGLIPLPKRGAWPEDFGVESVRRACSSGSAYSFAAGEPGSTFTPGSNATAIAGLTTHAAASVPSDTLIATPLLPMT
jgi:hypothetical protein